jgi:hypothetical protein
MAKSSLKKVAKVYLARLEQGLSECKNLDGTGRQDGSTHASYNLKKHIKISSIVATFFHHRHRPHSFLLFGISLYPTLLDRWNLCLQRKTRAHIFSFTYRISSAFFIKMGRMGYIINYGIFISKQPPPLAQTTQAHPKYTSLHQGRQWVGSG